ncbi:MAG: GGDEF domain-containing protein [Mobilitalea sp.]
MLYNFVYTNNRAETLSQITKIDTLTNLKNREGLYEDVLAKTDNNIPFAIIFIDLDDFKSINDNYGHQMGDTYLIEFAKAVTNLLTKNDIFYRLHGDEFVILTEISELEILSSRIKELNFTIVPNNVAFIGLSLGSATFPADGDKLKDLMYLADLRMYQVKKEKRRN